MKRHAVEEKKMYLSTKDAADCLGVSLRTVQLWVENGTLKAWKTAGGHRRILKDSVDDFLKEKRSLTKKANDNHELVMVMVDDDVEVLEAYRLSISLTDLPLKLITATNGYEGLIKIGKYNPDIIMTDLLMPTMDGYEMLNAVNLDARDCEIIVVTAADKDKTKFSDDLIKQINFFQKPLMFEVLENFLRNTIKEKVNV